MIRRKFLSIVYVAGLITPFMLTVFFLRAVDALVLLFIEILCLLLIVTLTIYLFKSALNKKLGALFPLISFFTIFIYLLIYSNLVKSADFVFLVKRQAKLEQIAASINRSSDKELQIRKVLPELKELGIQNVFFIDDRTLSFAIDCFIDNGSGIAFSKNSTPPAKISLGCGGHLTRWERLKNNWFAWSEN